ncbi:MAG: hypothetical protein ABR567_08200 [Myxococcales bacterium]|nr:hypothetical protein [Myxococcales bacterium]
MFSVKLVARPDPRMVEVPLEIEAELPREFDGAALLAASGLPRKVRIKAAKDNLKLSTAYRTDQLVGDIVKSSMRGTAGDVQRVQEAVNRFIRTVRERRQEGATLVVNSNGRGKIDVIEQMPASPRASMTPSDVPRLSPDKAAALEKRLAELEAGFARLGNIEERLTAMQSQISRALAAADVAGPGFEKPAAQVISRAAAATHKTTAVEAYAEGLRHELRATAAAALSRARSDTERADKAAALAAEAELLGAPADGTTQRLGEASASAAARQEALQRLSEEIEFYAPADLPVAAQLLTRLEDGPRAPDPAASLEPVAQAVVREAKGGDCKPRTAWLKRGAALCNWVLIEPARGDKVDPEWHQAVDSGGETVVRLACPGLKHTADGSGIVRARVQVDPAAASLAEEPDEPAAVPEPLAPPPPEETLVETRKIVLEPAPAKPQATGEFAAVAEAPKAEVKVEAAPPAPFVAPFGDLAKDEKIGSAEAAAAAAAASRMPKIVAEDPAHSDEALAAEVALAVETEMSTDKQWAQVARGPDAFDAESPADVSDDEVEEVHELKEPGPEKK